MRPAPQLSAAGAGVVLELIATATENAPGCELAWLRGFAMARVLPDPPPRSDPRSDPPSSPIGKVELVSRPTWK